jgi:hypothetical protein
VGELTGNHYKPMITRYYDHIRVTGGGNPHPHHYYGMTMPYIPAPLSTSILSLHRKPSSSSLTSNNNNERSLIGAPTYYDEQHYGHGRHDGMMRDHERSPSAAIATAPKLTGGAMVYLHDRSIVWYMGGKSSIGERKMTDVIYEWSPSHTSGGGRWQQSSTVRLPVPLAKFTAHYVNGYVVTIGGLKHDGYSDDASNQSWICDPSVVDRKGAITWYKAPSLLTYPFTWASFTI